MEKPMKHLQEIQREIDAINDARMEHMVGIHPIAYTPMIHKEARKKAGCKQVLLAAILGVSQQYLSQMERGLKPLNKKALDYILSQKEAKTLPTLHTPQNGTKQVVKKSLKTKRLRSKKRPTIVQLSKSTDFDGLDSESELRKVVEKWLWQDINADCRKCGRSCKQSWQVEIVSCPQRWD